MEPHQLAEFNYQFGMNIYALVQAMGMMSENMQRQQLGQSMAYTDSDFNKLLEDSGVHHNALVGSSQRIRE